MILIIGYGNPLRSDDAIGQHVAAMIEQRLQHEGLQVITAYQLTPELIEPIQYAELVVFIDARVGQRLGEVIRETVKPEISTGVFTHHVTPGTLLGAADVLYAAKPKGILISIVGADFEYGSDLSEQLSRMLPEIADEVENIIKTNLKVAI